ncbi:MAG: hypothetical protein ACM3O3_03300 [Syntrophothermus sp.]
MKKMKFFVCTFIITLLIICSNQTYGQTVKDTLIYLDSLQAMVNLIENNLPHYNQQIIENMDESTEGGAVIGYYEFNELKKIEAIFFGETGKWKDEYYLEDSVLFAVNIKEYYYNNSIMEEKVEIDSTSELNILIINKKLYSSGKDQNSIINYNEEFSLSVYKDFEKHLNNLGKIRFHR